MCRPEAVFLDRVRVHTVITSDFKARGGAAVKYLETRLPGPVMNGMLVYMADEQAGGAMRDRVPDQA